MTDQVVNALDTSPESLTNTSPISLYPLVEEYIDIPILEPKNPIESLTTPIPQIEDPIIIPDIPSTIPPIAYTPTLPSEEELEKKQAEESKQRYLIQKEY